jgi:hypothetical protein
VLLVLAGEEEEVARRSGRSAGALGVVGTAGYAPGVRPGTWQIKERIFEGMLVDIKRCEITPVVIKESRAAYQKIV